MFSALGGLSMRAIGRVVAAVLLAGAVAGAAAFAHLLGNVPGSTIFPAPPALTSAAGAGAPLVIRAALSPARPRAKAPVTAAPPWLRSTTHAPVAAPSVVVAAPVASPDPAKADVQPAAAPAPVAAAPAPPAPQAAVVATAAPAAAV